jgi:hypothetical protein
VKNNDSSDYFYQKIADLDLGQMFLIFNKILVSRSSKSVYWFKLEFNEELNEQVWKLYHTIEKPAFISFTGGNVRL